MKVQKDGTGWLMHCPACKSTHHFDGRWTFNGDVEKPTFRPSMRVSCGPYPEYSKRAGQNDECHFYVTDGQIEYLADSNHDLTGQTVPVPDYPAAES